MDGLFLFEFEDAKLEAPNPTTNTGNDDTKRSRLRNRAKMSCTILSNRLFWEFNTKLTPIINQFNNRTTG